MKGFHKFGRVLRVYRSVLHVTLQLFDETKKSSVSKNRLQLFNAYKMISRMVS